MRIFLDTNCYFDNWFVDSAPFRLLFYFLNNAGHRLVISRLVIQEVENKRRQKLAEQRELFEKASHVFTSLTKVTVPALPADADLPPYDLLANLNGMVDRLEIIEYDDIPHSRIVERAMHIQRPFLESEKGYRDTLIWVSLMDNLKQVKASTEICFISENKNDFFKGQKEPEFHDGLQADLKQLPPVVKLVPYRHLSHFIDARVDKHAHAVDLQHHLDTIEEFAVEQFLRTIEIIDGPVTYELYWFLNEIHPAIANVKHISADYGEGPEDFTIDANSGLNEAEIYVGVFFEIRGFFVEMTIPREDYDKNKCAAPGGS